MLIGQHRHAFAKDLAELTGCDIYEHKIHTGDARPVRRPYYRPSIEQRDQIDHTVDELVDVGIVEKCTSEWASSVVIVKKQKQWMALRR